MTTAEFVVYITEEKHGTQWTSRMQLDNLDFADDLAVLSQTQQQMQEKAISVAAARASVVLGCAEKYTNSYHVKSNVVLGR
ncbi:unnamed protein product [Schistosoma margrebowiei]|uniref:Uncharacterized protein n=1 Tax=Schistosoma margrebowiei TaxID=48269 RepID=A0A183M8G8_9TREM|nr:unnamed protein product [Schistosoma margrebowiei]